MCEVTIDEAVLAEHVRAIESAYQYLLLEVPEEFRDNPLVKPEDAPGLNGLLRSTLAKARADAIVTKQHLARFREALAAGADANRSVLQFESHCILDCC